MRTALFPEVSFMREAMRLARKGIGRTSPNPAVGAVVVRDGRVVGKGFHRGAGLPHAEVEALLDAGAAAREADMYVTLEPCDHQGRTGPCTKAILDAGIARVAYAIDDPNPKVCGRGAKRLREAGLTVHAGLLSGDAFEMNRAWRHWVVSGKPFVTLKLAVSLDGQIAAATGESQWITGERARLAVHRMRRVSDAILVGGETARKDDPLLTPRVSGAVCGRLPKRVVLTSRPFELKKNRLFNSAGGGVIVVCASCYMSANEAKSFSASGVRALRLPSKRGKIRAADLLSALGAENVTSLMVEGGGKTAGWLVEEGAIDRYVLFVAPLLLGEGIRAVSGWAANAPSLGKKMLFKDIRRVGSDLMVVAEKPLAAKPV
ncbi:MAG: bifunctional diaminohydroxyphosphoribosylaminopyrimidine deaminase/5-amino-6-(5-phosphoribosylamino)uracil reductase RibD [Syntrophorhabdaceae bacterium]|nr:bifunctional diaminohydroxyphosphoribosylaminopyrimidine deaminase/5-amino-6-(5-phosphoribosylamino)uracil reductase RibD [Syntrophorhabdaceae bacterium]